MAKVDRRTLLDRKKLLEWACINNNLQLAKRVVRKGVDLTVKSDQYPYGLPLIEACKGKEETRTELVQFLLEQPGGMETLNAQNIIGDTPLISAVAFGNASVARVLLSEGADWMLTSKFHETPIDVARWIDENECVQPLMGKSAVYM